jgi:uncharacterized membrane protein
VSNSDRADDAELPHTRGGRRFAAARSRIPGIPAWPAWSVAAVLAVFYAAVAIRRHVQLLTSAYDLGIYDQAVRSYSEGHLPFNSIQGPHFDVLGDHFSPVLALLAPLYWIHDSPTTLLVAQAVLIAVGVVPLMRWAQRDIGLGAALVVGFGYGFSSGVANAVTFDFHEVAFAAPLLSFAAVAFGQGRLTAAVLWAAPLVLVKEDLGLTVAVLGLLVAWRGRRALGLATAVGGGLASALAVVVVIPAFNPAGRNTKVGKFGDSIFHQFTVLLTPDVKIVTLVLLLAPTAFLAVRSPIVLLAVPTLAWRFLAVDTAYWGTQYHYGLVLMPVLFAALVDVLRRPLVGRRWYLAASVVVTVYLIPQNGFSPAFGSTLWRTDPATAAIHQLLDRIPSGTTVAASNQLAPQLTERDAVTLIGRTPLAVSRPEYVVSEVGAVGFPLGPQGQAAWLDDARAHGYSDIGSTGTVVLLQRNPGALVSG